MSDEKEDPRAVPADQRSQGPNETMMISSAELASKVASAATGERRVIQGTPKLIGRSDAVAGVTLELTKPKTTIGRAENSDLRIEDGTVSSRHAQIVNENGVWRVVNLISTNGTSVNGNTAIVSYLAPGDIISFGRVEMKFEVEGSEATRAAPRKTRGGGRSSSVNAILWAAIGAGVVVILGVAAFLLLR
jgi:pSer/pThr/pTyr-binding forkhead associated (FHA) protein